MTHEDREKMIKQIMTLLWKHKDYPPRLLAERIVIDILEKSLNDVKDVYEYLLFIDTSNPN